MSEILTGGATDERVNGGTTEEDAGYTMGEDMPVTAGEAEAQGEVHCLICNLANGPAGSVNVRPCRCGYVVHDQCLIDVAMQFEDMNPDTRSIGCRICRRTYNISPVKSIFLKMGLKAFVFYRYLCHLGTEVFLILVTDMTFIKVGTLVFKMAWGSEEASRLISSMDPFVAVLACQMVPIAAIAINSIPWERSFLRLLRKFSKIPVVGGIFPLENPDIPDIYEGSSKLPVELAGGVLLPFYAVAVSKLFVGSIADPFYRLVFGGFTFVFLKGISKMYYKQKKYSRFCTLRIAN